MKTNVADRELLKLAAKAAGVIHPEVLENHLASGWNPLTDDGDAFRLSVKLGITSERDQFDGEFYAHAIPPGTHQGCDEPYGDDPLAAIRRAIVRAAAEIGKASHEKASN